MESTTIFICTASGAILVKKIPTTAISAIIRFTPKHLSTISPVSHTDWEKGHIIKINDLEECNHDFKYLFNILSNKEIPSSDRRKKALIILKQQLNSKTVVGLVRFLTCVVSILVLFTFLGDTTSVYLTLFNYFIFYLHHCFVNGASFVKTYYMIK
jgi:hypothetical protein